MLVFFKVSCPVCQYAFPSSGARVPGESGANVTVLGISQDKARDTKKFLREYGVTFPVALDDPAKYAVSNAYGLTNVPTIFYIAPSGEIEVSSVGWSKAEVEAINRSWPSTASNRRAALAQGRGHPRLPRRLRLQELIRGRGSETDVFIETQSR